MQYEKIAENIKFDNQFVKNLPQDPETRNFPRQVTGACYSRVQPAKVTAPKLVAFSKEVAQDLGFSKIFCESEKFSQIFTGNILMPGMEPFAMCYGGHQFGNWAGQLGDGRAINLGEILTPLSARRVLQLKGAGPTPYSRNADGLAVLRSSIREFLCSEAMFHLGVPTTRALSLTLTGEMVERDMFYDGHPKLEPGAVVCRVAPSFIRFGNFEIFSSRNETNLLKKLTDYTILTDFPHLGDPCPEIYLKWFKEICEKTCEMIVHWMRVGFVHGVMNTDNMSIMGMTIDYGPYGWVENYDPGWTPNTTDRDMRRYSFGKQPEIALWNLVQLGNAIFPLIKEAAPLQEIINNYSKMYEIQFNSMMLKKLGLTPGNGLSPEKSQVEIQSDKSLITGILDLLTMVETDMTIFFRRLAMLDIETWQKNNTRMEEDLISLTAPMMEAYYSPKQISTNYLKQLGIWIKKYISRMQSDPLSLAQIQKQMNKTNPKHVLRNYLAQLAIEKAEKGDFSMVHELLELMRRPYDEQPGKEEFAKKRPGWAKTKPGCSMLSCSS